MSEQDVAVWSSEHRRSACESLGRILVSTAKERSTRQVKQPIEQCPCGSALAYAACCGRWHKGEPAPSAEALMRSRYAAFVRGDARYLLDTWHPSTRPPTIVFDPKLKWLGLKIVAGETMANDAAEVEFIARYRIGVASVKHLHERSRFVRECERWLYVDGDIR
ncbi:MAG: YchJ family metal-binding protein [Gemmataceae bacterium]